MWIWRLREWFVVDMVLVTALAGSVSGWRATWIGGMLECLELRVLN